MKTAEPCCTRSAANGTPMARPMMPAVDRLEPLDRCSSGVGTGVGGAGVGGEGVGGEGVGGEGVGAGT